MLAAGDPAAGRHRMIVYAVGGAIRQDKMC
jgi:hypothetical protein